MLPSGIVLGNVNWKKLIKSYCISCCRQPKADAAAVLVPVYVDRMRN